MKKRKVAKMMETARRRSESQWARIFMLEADVKRFRVHSEKLNRVTWMIAETLGLVSDDVSDIEADPIALAQQLCDQYTQMVADRKELLDLCDLLDSDLKQPTRSGDRHGGLVGTTTIRAILVGGKVAGVLDDD